MKLKRALAACGMIVVFSALILSGCGNTKTLDPGSGGAAESSSQSGEASQSSLETGEITEGNLETVCEVLEEGGLSNVDVFRTWVEDTLAGDDRSEDDIGFSDSNCRMNVMLLAGDSISFDSVEESYDGTYLMFDMEAIEEQETYQVLKDVESRFTTLFGEMPVPESGFADAFPANLETYGIRFGGEKFSVISIVFKAFEEEQAFVGHTGILVDCRENPSVDSDYLFVEKIAFGDVYRISLVNSEEELMQIFAERPDYQEEEGEPAPLVYKNEVLLGEIPNV